MCRSSAASSFGTKRQMSAIVSTRRMAAIVYWILVRDSSLAFRDGRLWSPTTSGGHHFLVRPRSCGRSSHDVRQPNRARISAAGGNPRRDAPHQSRRSTPAWRVEAGQTLTNVDRKRLTIPTCPSHGFLLDCGHDGNRRSPRAKAAKPRREPAAGG
jgi:hypothetical protein